MVVKWRHHLTCNDKALVKSQNESKRKDISQKWVHKQILMILSRQHIIESKFGGHYLSDKITRSMTKPPINLTSSHDFGPHLNFNYFPTSSNVISRDIEGQVKKNNIFDTVLGEASDLLAAALEAQTFGRLKMASTYSLLVHARLVGLGKRFDRSMSDKDLGIFPIDIPCENSLVKHKSKGKGSTSLNQATMVQAKNIAKFPNREHLINDNELMEHIAQSAGELDNRRTGRRKNHGRTGYAKKFLSRNYLCTSNIKDNEITLLWTEDEKRLCIEAVELYGGDNLSDIAKSIGTKTVAQVELHLRSSMYNKKVDLTTLKSNISHRLRDIKNISNEIDLSIEGINKQKKRSETKYNKLNHICGRKKYPTKANHTVPNAKFDARTLLSGRPLSI